MEQDRLGERLFTIASHSTIAFIQIFMKIQIQIFVFRYVQIFMNVQILGQLVFECQVEQAPFLVSNCKGGKFCLDNILNINMNAYCIVPQ